MFYVYLLNINLDVVVTYMQWCCQGLKFEDKDLRLENKVKDLWSKDKDL